MQNIHIIKKSDFSETYRVAKIRDEYDLQDKEIVENIDISVDIPDAYNIGVICGNSGTGKTTIGRYLFGQYMIKNEYGDKPIIEEVGANNTFEEVADVFNSIGFSSIPSWLKPYNVLSTGEKMRVDLAKALLENDIVCFDEFTSVVDRTVAKTMCLAINRYIKRHKEKKIILISCHKDILNYLDTDWIIDTDKMKQVFTDTHDLNKDLKLENAIESCGGYLGNIII